MGACRGGVGERGQEGVRGAVGTRAHRVSRQEMRGTGRRMGMNWMSGIAHEGLQEKGIGREGSRAREPMEKRPRGNMFRETLNQREMRGETGLKGHRNEG
jgi:hypothetical protein